jgi:hypothetical protein
MKHTHTRFGVSIVVSIQTAVLWVVILCSLVGGCKENCCFCLLGQSGGTTDQVWQVDMDGGLSEPRFKWDEDVINLY